MLWVVVSTLLRLSGCVMRKVYVDNVLGDSAPQPRQEERSGSRGWHLIYEMCTYVVHIVCVPPIMLSWLLLLRANNGSVCGAPDSTDSMLFCPTDGSLLMVESGPQGWTRFCCQTCPYIHPMEPSDKITRKVSHDTK